MRDKCWFKFDKVKARVFLAFLREKISQIQGVVTYVIPALKRLRQEDQELKPSVGFIRKPYRKIETGCSSN